MSHQCDAATEEANSILESNSSVVSLDQGHFEHFVAFWALNLLKVTDESKLREKLGELEINIKSS